MILKTIAGTMMGANCYIVGSEKTKEGLIIDPGEDAPDILSAVRQLGLSISTIVATHGHFDHIGALAQVKESTGAKFAIHSQEATTFRGHSQMPFRFIGSHQPPPDPDRLLEEDDTIDIGDLRFTVIHTPGHSPGGICLLGDGVVFTGDTLFNFGIGRADFVGPGIGYEILLKSIKEKLLPLPDDTVVYPGHGPKSTIGTERDWNPFLQDI
jgi:glyoxylase-like metal-dependent hydrolase (beta-lactamase superfamily II)